MRPALARATAGVPSPRILDCGCGNRLEPGDAAPVRARGRFRSDRHWSAFAATHGHTAPRPASRHIPFYRRRVRLVTSFDVFQTPARRGRAVRDFRDGRVLKPGGWMLLHVAAPTMLHGRHSVLSEEERRYTPSRLRMIVEGAEASDRAAHVRSRQPAADHVAVRVWHRFTARWRGRGRGGGDHGSGGAGETPR